MSQPFEVADEQFAAERRRKAIEAAKSIREQPSLIIQGKANISTMHSTSMPTRIVLVSVIIVALSLIISAFIIRSGQPRFALSISGSMLIDLRTGDTWIHSGNPGVWRHIERVPDRNWHW
jgi:hypothetical protein